VYVYKRPEAAVGEWANHPRVRLFNAPLLDLSATYVRACLREGKSVRYLVPEAVYQYLETSTLYRQD
jgi:nicotinate-nucleotide adenylyltransferase